MDRLEDLKARIQDVQDNLASAEKYHWSEESQLALVDELHDLQEQYDKLYAESLEGEGNESE